MARILLISSGIPSPLNSITELGLRLRDDGHVVSLAAPKSAQRQVCGHNLRFHEIPPAKVNAYAPLITRPSLAERIRPRSRRRRKDLAIRALGIDRLPDLLESTNPDLVIIDAELHAHVMIAHCRGYRVVLCTSMYITPPSPDRPPLHFSIVPGRGALGSRLGVRISWLWYRFWRSATIAKKAILYQGGDYVSATTQLARRVGFDLPAFRTGHSWQMPWALRFRTLVALPGVLDFPPRTLPHHDYLGPMILRRGDPSDAEEGTVQQFRSAARDAPNQIRIFAAFGTILTPDRDFIDRLWTAVANNADWRLLCVLGRNWKDQFGAPPENVSVATWAPQAELLALCDAFVFPGGSASVVESIAAKTPMLIYPRTIDQYGNSARVVHHRLGQAGSPDDGAERIGQRLSEIISDAEMPERLNVFREAQAVCKVDKVAERVVSEILSGRRA